MERLNNYQGNKGHYNPEGNQNHGYGQSNYQGGHGGHGGQGGYGGQKKPYQGGYNDNQHYGGKGGFDNKPKQGFAGKSIKYGDKVNVVTNQFVMKLTGDKDVHIYDVKLDPSQAIDEAFVIHQVARELKSDLEAALGTYVFSGRNCFTIKKLTEPMTFTAKFRETTYTMTIKVENVHTFNCRDMEDIKMEDDHVAHTLLNVIIKEAFRSTHLRQLGRVPRFFDGDLALTLEASRMQIWPGFRASAYNYQQGMCLVLDSCNKFMSTTSCLEKINQLKRECGKDAKAAIENAFAGTSIIAGWGHKKAYLVKTVSFGDGPYTQTFKQENGQEISIANYFMKQYNVKLTDKNQPLFVCEVGGKDVHLPPEYCTLDGIPDDVRQDKQSMREILQSARKSPHEKFNDVTNFSHTLFEQFKQKQLGGWGITINPEPIEFQASILPPPTIVQQDGQKVEAEQNVMRRLAIQVPVHLQAGKWLFIYSVRNYDFANKTYECMVQCSGQLGVKVGEPLWVELKDDRDIVAFKEELYHHTKNFKPQFALAMLSSTGLYANFKKALYEYGIVSQVVTCQTAKRMNMSVATNIVKQINAKVNAELYNIKLPDELSSKTMLIGLDVCHQGKSSIVGFCASYNKRMNHYYSEHIIQKKGQEIVNEKLANALKNALTIFCKKHGGNDLPEHFIIYRDGVGDAMRHDVIKYEISQFRKVIDEVYNKAATKPMITLIIVNKRIMQRFLTQQNGEIINPPAGTLIDKGLVENSDSDQQFDFYLSPQNVTQGTVTPTHFFVAFNDSKLKKVTIEKLTHDLCYCYFNWAGAIKVPAPCMYAHKIAECCMNLGLNKGKPTDKQKQNMDSHHVPELIDENLHFL